MSRQPRATIEQIQERKNIAIEIFNTYKDDPSYTQGDVIGIIQKRLKLPRHRASTLVLSLNLYPKRIIKKTIASNNPDTLICPQCQTEKPKSEFPTKGKTRNGDDRYSYCRDCHSVYQKILRIKKLFNLTMDEYERLGTSCSICGRTGKTKQISVDHDHKTGLVRGRLCDRCNRGLAWFQDSPDLLRLCADYLENPPAEKILGKKVFGRTGRVNSKRRKHAIRQAGTF